MRIRMLSILLSVCVCSSVRATIVSPPNGADLAALLLTKTASTTIDCVANGNYALNSTVTVTAPWLTLNLNGSTLAATPSAGAASNIVVNAAAQGFTISNAHITKGVVFLRAYAPHCRMVNCVSDDYLVANGTWTGISTNFAWTDAGGDDLQLLNCHIGVTGSVSVYIGGTSGLAEQCAFCGSIGEYDFRREPSANENNTPLPFTLDHCSFAYKNMFQKQSVIGCRLGEVWVTNSLIEANIRFGEEPPAGYPPITSATACAPNCQITNCQFIAAASLPVGDASYIVPISMYQGSTVTCTGTSFWLLNGHSAVAEGAPNVFNCTGAKVHYPANMVFPAGFPKFISSSSTGTANVSGTTTDKAWNPPSIPK